MSSVTTKHVLLKNAQPKKNYLHNSRNCFHQKSLRNQTELWAKQDQIEIKCNSFRNQTEFLFLVIYWNTYECFHSITKKQWLNWREFNCLTLPSISYQITEKFANQTTNKSFDWHKFSPESLAKFSKTFYYMYVKKLVQEVLTILSLKACLLNEKP